MNRPDAEPILEAEPIGEAKTESMTGTTIEPTSESPKAAKGYRPQDIEAGWYKTWKESGVFHAEPDPNKPPYCITIPPPNITGSLHMGHALNNSVLDTMTRWHRMRGFATLCLPGTDHAGIATQAVVERELAKEGKTRHDLGREAFIAKCWEWREQYGTRIYFQFEKLGCSYDWERVRFTLDDSYAEAVMTEFEAWYNRGLIYRGTRIVNWDVKLNSSVSDIEVYTEARNGKLYHLRYPFVDGSGSITIATTRPETLLGDAAVAANPEDGRYMSLFGKLLKLPLTDREIPLIADDYAKPEFGSGAVKVTPAHDPNDWECGQRHNLLQLVVIGKDGKMTEAAGAEFAGLERYEARKLVLSKLEALGLLEKIEDYVVQTPISDRSKTVIEPMLSEEWFVDMKPLAQPAIDVVKSGKIKFIPERYEGIYLHWLENIRDWNISRSLWWGHRIPVWWTSEAKGGEVVSAQEDSTSSPLRHCFARTREEAIVTLGTENCWQDEAVLDTWFSSALWPQATLGWPLKTEDLAYFYPTNLLSTAQEILYLWVARMVMTGLDFTGEIPFHEVYIHATVLDDQGRRMSKSLGNGIDPIDLVDKYGADATRLSLLQQAGMNQDIKYSEKRTEEAAKFCNKLWQASNFVLMNLNESTKGVLPEASKLTTADRWILSRFNETVMEVSEGFKTYHMDVATRSAYAFFWNDFCDWFIEMAKPRFRTEGEDKAIAQNVLKYTLDGILRLLHPMIPFITEEIWGGLWGNEKSAQFLCLSEYPKINPAFEDVEACAAIETTIEATRALRNLRAELGIAPGIRLSSVAVATSENIMSALTLNAPLITELARLGEFSVLATSPDATSGKWVGTPITGAEVLLEIGEALDLDKERERIEKELAEVTKQITRAEGMLSNANFTAKASPEKVAEEQKRLQDWREKERKLEERKQLFA